jgi:pimeloyl-ACP methyl ester carboxylesterase
MARDELQILVHGATYDHRYWDWPLEPDLYSYVGWDARSGYATLAIDRIGCGASSKPLARQSTLTAQARVQHDIVTAGRAGALGGTAFSLVVLIGHSMGSALSVAEASEYQDADAVVLTDSLAMDARTLNNDPRADMFYVPALEDPAQRHLTGLVDGDYLSPTPESRAPMFYVGVVHRSQDHRARRGHQHYDDPRRDVQYRHGIRPGRRDPLSGPSRSGGTRRPDVRPRD